MAKLNSMIVSVKVKLSFWDALKMRIAGWKHLDRSMVDVVRKEWKKK